MAGADRFSAYETAMDLAQDERRFDAAMAERGVPLADFENAAGWLPHERRSMSEMQQDLAPNQVPCKVAVGGDDVVCGKPAPRLGPYAGRCEEHREDTALRRRQRAIERANGHDEVKPGELADKLRERGLDPMTARENAALEVLRDLVFAEPDEIELVQLAAARVLLTH